MKNGTKVFLTLICVLCLAFALTLISSAAEYTVNSADEFSSAYAGAQDGDTIIIKSSITATINFNKSITYILDGNGIVWTAGAGVGTADKEYDVKIQSVNGTNSFKPNAQMWYNRYNNETNKNLVTTTWTFEGLDGAIIKLDLSAVAARLMYGTYFKEINFKNGAHVMGCNNSNLDNSYFFQALTLNVYDGAKVYGNYVQAYRGFFRVDALNIYGGEFYGNYFGEYGMVIGLSNGVKPAVSMYGGEIHDTYLNFGNTGLQEGLFNNSFLNMYGGKIYNNYVKGASTGGHSILAGGKRMVDGSIYDNYYVTSWETPTRNADGVYSSNIDVSTATVLSTGLGTTTVVDYSVIFKAADGKVLDAFMVQNGAVVRSASGLTEVTVPSASEKWSSEQFGCVATELVLNAHNTYYALAEHKVVDDYDCTTALSCTKCGLVTVEANESHNSVTTFDYASFIVSGTKSVVCNNEGCNHSVTEAVGALVEYRGISSSQRSGSICVGYSVNVEIVEEYVLAGYTFEIGAVAYIPLENETEIDPIGLNLEPNDEYTISAQISNTTRSFDFVLKGFNEEYYDLSLVMCAYVYDGEKVSYVCVSGGALVQEKYATTLKFSDYVK